MLASMLGLFLASTRAVSASRARVGSAGRMGAAGRAACLLKREDSVAERSVAFSRAIGSSVGVGWFVVVVLESARLLIVDGG